MRLTSWSVAAFCVVLGAAAGVAFAFRGSPGYRAHASLVVAPALRKRGPALATLTATAAELVRSRSVTSNAAAALHLTVPPKVEARAVVGTAVVDVFTDASTQVEATRVLQQVLVAFQPIANARLRPAAGGPVVAVWDPASASRRARPVVGDGLVGALLGALLAGTLRLRPRPRRTNGSAHPPTESTTGGAPEPAAAVPLAPHRVPPRQPVAPPLAPPAGPAEAPAATGLIAELERRVAAETDPARREELAAYLQSLAPFADPEGGLPQNLLALVEHEFGDI